MVWENSPLPVRLILTQLVLDPWCLVNLLPYHLFFDAEHGKLIEVWIPIHIWLSRLCSMGDEALKMWCGDAMMNEFEGCDDKYMFIPLDSLIVQKQEIWNLYPCRIHYAWVELGSMWWMRDDHEVKSKQACSLKHGLRCYFLTFVWTVSVCSMPNQVHTYNMDACLSPKSKIGRWRCLDYGMMAADLY